MGGASWPHGRHVRASDVARGGGFVPNTIRTNYSGGGGVAASPSLLWEREQCAAQGSSSDFGAGGPPRIGSQ
jgi:hypothetical protein